MSERRAVSVVVSTYQRASALAALIAALERQTYPIEDVEVVIVDNGSTDGTGDVLKGLARRSTLHIRPIRLEVNDGSSGGRNAGWRASTGHVVAFTDDDCLPEPDWLKAGLAAMDDDVILVQGRTEPQRKVRALERGAGSARPDGLYPTCNVFYRGRVLEETGGFDRTDGTRLGFRPGSFGSGYGFGEDTLLAWRVARGRKAVFAPDAVVWHAVTQPPLREYVARNWIVGSFPALVREVPELRDLLLRRRVFLGYRRLPLYATVAALLTPFRWIAAAGALWWVVARALDVRRRGGGRRSQVVAVPVEMAVDAVSAVALVRGCVRARTIVI
ncbi:MAG: glycosyltransferase family 2 protein [Actinomycetota bacterium]